MKQEVRAIAAATKTAVEVWLLALLNQTDEPDDMDEA
jgi:hypothetical protein